MSTKKGSLSISSDNIFPIIKKWMYSDHDIFIREIVSNGSDAITKLKKLALIGEYTEPADAKYQIDVEVSAKDKTITFTDNGLGMTSDEVEEYINQIAFSGAKDFVEKYKDKANDDQIIGHFGLGFYSAFMVADKVSIDTLSYKEGAASVHWVSDGGTEFEMSDGSWDKVGTKITLYLNEDSMEFANEYRVREVLDKYCSFMPYEIYLTNADAGEQTEIIEKDELKDTDTVIETVIKPAETKEETKEDGTKEVVETAPSREQYKIKKRPVAVNDTHPLWTKHPNECSEDEYKDFYRKVFRDYKEPLFWIHLNMDYPFNLKGILYFPKINMEFESIEGVIKLYNNQVFIADNIKEVIPEYLMLLKGVIDCPDLPLNVSRSALQNDGFVQKISDYISKKVADKLIGMCKTDRENYEKYWDDIAPFIKYGFLKDEKFAQKMNDFILFKDIDHKYLTLKDLLPEEKKEDSDESKAEGEEKPAETDDSKDGEGKRASDSKEDKDKKDVKETKIYYVTDEKEQARYIDMYRTQKINAVILNHNIDTPFISKLESQNDGLKFLRIDTDLEGAFKDDAELSEDEKKSCEAAAEAVKKAIGDDKLTVKLETLKDASTASLLTVSEESRRMQDMMKQYGMAGMDMSMFGSEGNTLVLNLAHPLVKYLLDHNEGDVSEKLSKQLYDLALIAHGTLSPERMSEFIQRTNEIMTGLTK